MQTRPYVFFATSNQANAASRQIISPGILYAVLWSVQLNTVADNDTYSAELSFSVTGQTTTDNAQGVISTAYAFTNLVTSGMTIGAINFGQSGLYFPVFGGQLLYLNTNGIAQHATHIIAYVSEA